MLTVEQKELHWSINKIQLIISADIYVLSVSAKCICYCDNFILPSKKEKCK